MIEIKIRSMRPGACGWYRREKDEVFDVSFSDKSLVDPKWKYDLLRAIRRKVGERKTAALPTNGVNGVAVPK